MSLHQCQIQRDTDQCQYPDEFFFQPFVSQKLRYISEINILFRLSHIQHVSSSSIPIGAGSPNWIGEWESGCRNRWVRQWRRFYKLKLMLEKRVKVIFKVLEDTKADLVGFEKQHESTKLTKKNKKLNIIGRLSLPKKKKKSLRSAKRIDRTYQNKTKNWTCKKMEHNNNKSDNIELNKNKI